MVRLRLSTLLLGILAAVPLTAQAPARSIVNGPIAARADSALREMSTRGFSGVALVAKDGEVLLAKGYGLADRAANRAMTGSTVVQIGSNTKDFTAVAILQLMEGGKLTLDDSIGKYFPSVPTDKRGITIRMLLNHRAGFDQHLGGDDEVIGRDEEIRKALSSALKFPAGTGNSYSNIGYSLLAAIIEQLSGGSYDQYVQQHILTPLGMHETGLLLPKFDPTRLARGYRGGEAQPTFLERPHAADGPWWNLRGNGGMLSTVSDMLLFYRALMSDGPLLKPASRDIMFHPNEPAILAGSDMTYYFFYTRAPRAGLDIFLATNATDYPASKARGELDVAVGLAGPPGGGRGGQIVTTGPGGGRAGGSAGAVGPVTFPDTPAARAARKYLRAWLNNNPDSMRVFLRDDVVLAADDHRTLDERVDRMKSMHDDLGFLTPVAIVTSTELEITFTARSAQQGEITMSFTVEPKAPWRITQIRILAG
jgi:CubicO group peptidase (beta-lactamase class C family)